MASENNGAAGGGIGFVGLLTVAFIVLKLCGVIHWSWWLVLIGLWVPLVIACICFIALLILAVLGRFY